MEIKCLAGVMAIAVWLSVVFTIFRYDLLSRFLSPVTTRVHSIPDVSFASEALFLTSNGGVEC